MKSTPRLLAACLLVFCSLAAAQTPGLPDEEERYDIDFRDTGIREFIATISRLTDRPFVVDPRVQGTISLTSQRPLTRDELYRLFESELQVNGYAVVELPDGQARVVPDELARTQPLPTDIGEREGGGVATRIIETRHLEASMLASILEPLVDPRVGVITAHPSGRQVVVTDWQDNLNRLARLARLLDERQESQAEIINVQHTRPADLAETLDGLLQDGDGGGPRVIAAPRADALLVLGNPAQRQQVRELASGLDTAVERHVRTRVIYLNHAAAEDVLTVLEELQSSGATLVNEEGERVTPPSSRDSEKTAFAVHPSTNALVLTGPPESLEAYLSIVEQLDIRRAQVAVEAIIAEITESRARQLGMQWLFADTGSGSTVPVGGVNFGTAGSTGITELAAAAAGEDTTALANLLGGLNGITTGVGRIDASGLSFAALLNALRSDADTNLLSTPSLMTLDNAEAYILVGQEVPFVTGSTTVDNANPYQTIQREDVGIKLRIRPQISADNTIRLAISQEVSSVASNVSASDVVTNKREIETAVTTRDGGIVVLGGLISNQSSNTRQQVPLLGDIPLLGNLFRYSDSSREKQNLVVFIRARVIRDDRSLDAGTARKYRHMRAQQLLRDLEEDQVLPPLESQVASLDALFPSGRERLGELAR
ncbi:type II secretion system secretin GspD [Halomonas sp. SSL-5]|uniref:type II secretion system secretin GspD n=1 Tax=Halomonas sp. SSL-5 TaxID=3065855 RepID=UPI002738F86B|nr:type II secretion system secretin GspD [Halomonas sp. SSL-5]MDY7117016.1 type II secretion system secretin GspD [Halomonas sp. SSL-5]